MKKELPRDLYQSVADEYEAMIEIPELKPEHQFFLCPIGLVGAGKSTVMRPLSKELLLVRIEADGIRKILHTKGYDYDATKDIVFTLTEKYADAGYSIAIDSDCARKETRKIIEQAAEELHAKVVYLHIAPPESFIIHKMQHHEPSWLFKSSSEAIENYMHQKPHHENLDVTYLATIDTSRDDLPIQIEITRELIKTETRNV